MRCFALLLTVFTAGLLTARAEVPKIDPPLEAAPLREGAPVGFVTHPHMPPAGGNLKALAGNPATAELSNVFGWRMMRDFTSSDTVKLEDINVKFDLATDWLREVYRSGRRALPILDTSITHSEVPWRAAMTDRVGENLVGMDGKKRGWSSLHSPVFRESVYRYIDQLIDWVKLNDTAHRVPAYFDGAEWFWPWGTQDFSPLARKSFREWLKAKYGTLEKLNTAWGARFADWDAVEPVHPHGLGEYNSGHTTFSLSEPVAGTWHSAPIPVEPGMDLVATVDARTSGTFEGLVHVAIAWLDKDGKEFFNSEVWSAEDACQPDGLIEIHAQVPRPLREAPAVPVKTRLNLKLYGPGEVTFTAPHLAIDSGDARPRLADEMTTWTFEGIGAVLQASHLENNQQVLTIAAQAPPQPYGRSGVAWEDWENFTFESMAGWLNASAEHIKQRDPSRQVVSYVGWVFGMQAMWDGSLIEQRFDISLANSPAIDVNGFQMGIAGRDFTPATYLVDMARKYGKPMWATDLVDFPYGLYSGFEPIYRASQALVQHGLGGFYYYNWWGTWDYSYSDHLTRSEQDRLTGDDLTALQALKDYELRADVAFLSPIMTYSLADEGGYKGDMLDAGGWYHLILDLGLTPDVWTPYEITRWGRDKLKQYKVIFIPDCPVLPAEVNDALTEYVRQGGVVLGGGRPPVKNLAGEPLAGRLVTGEPDANEPWQGQCGQGRVIWLAGKVGRNYWGKVRRTAVYGNTPAMQVELPDPGRTQQARRAARERLICLMRQAGVRLPAMVDPRTGVIHLALWNPKSGGDPLLYLVHNGEGRLYDAPLTLDLPGVEGRTIEAWTDFDRKTTVTVGPGGRVDLPGFSHGCLARLIDRKVDSAGPPTP